MQAFAYAPGRLRAAGSRAASWLPVLLAMIFVAAVIALLPLSWAAVVVVGALSVLLSFARLEYGLCLLVFSVPFSSLMAVETGGLSVSYTEMLGGLLVLAWLGRGAVSRRLAVVFTPLAFGLLVFLVLVSASLLVAREVGPALKELLRWLQMLGVYLLVVSVVRERRWQRALLVAILLAVCVEALLGFYQFFARVGPPSFAIGRFLRAYGTFGQPNPYAGYLGMVIPLAYALALYWSPHHIRMASGHMITTSFAGAQEAESGWQRWLRGWAWLGGDRLRVLVWLSLGVASAAMLMSFSRGGWLGLAAALIVVTMLASRRGAVLMALGGTVLGSLLALGLFKLLPGSIVERVSIVSEYFTIFDVREVVLTPENWALVERMAHWQAAWRMYEDHALFGVGIGNYVVAYADYYLPPWTDPLGHAHNYYLNVLAELGAIGLTAYLLMLCSWLGLGLVSLIRAERGLPRAVALGCIGVLVASMVHNFFDNLYVHGMNVHLAIILGLLSLSGWASAEGNAVGQSSRSQSG